MMNTKLLGAILGCVCENPVRVNDKIIYEYSGESQLIWATDSITIEELETKYNQWVENINNEFNILIQKQ